MTTERLYVTLGAATPEHSYLGGCALPSSTAEVGSLEEASVVVQDYVTAHQLGASSWYGEPDSGRVQNAAGEQVARIAYNGNITTPGDRFYR